MNPTCGRSSPSMPGTATDHDPIAARGSPCPGPTNPSPPSPRRGSSAADPRRPSTNISEPHRSPGQGQWPSSGTPQAPKLRATTSESTLSGQGWGLAKKIGPHTLRHAFITAALDAGVPLRDVQEAASHADPCTAMRYDRARVSLNRHATYIVAAYIAGAAR